MQGAKLIQQVKRKKEDDGGSAEAHGRIRGIFCAAWDHDLTGIYVSGLSSGGTVFCI